MLELAYLNSYFESGLKSPLDDAILKHGEIDVTGWQKIDEVARARIEALFAALGDEGFRVLGIAWRSVPLDYPHAVVGDESELVFAGFAAFLDPPKASAGEALAALQASGVAIKIVTGDNERVTRHVCEQLGIADTGVLLGTDIQAMNDDALR